jgi:hypothetical protein
LEGETRELLGIGCACFSVACFGERCGGYIFLDETLWVKTIVSLTTDDLYRDARARL